MCGRVKIIALGALFAVLAASGGGADDLPAVSGLNGKIEGMRGDLNGESLTAFSGSLSAPLLHSFGVQADFLGADYSAGPTFGGGLHGFWRDPGLGLIGAVGSRTDIDGTAINRFGLEGEYYLGPLTVAATAGLQNGDSIHTGWGALDLRWYPLDDLVVEIGGSAQSSERAGHLGFEWQPLSGAAPGLSLFADGAIGSSDYDHAMGGVRFYFGAGGKSLKARHREDDPVNLMVNGVSGAVAATAGKPGGMSGTSSGGSLSGGGGSGGAGGGGGGGA